VHEANSHVEHIGADEEIYIEKLVPQPQDAVALRLLILKAAPISSPAKSGAMSAGQLFAWCGVTAKLKHYQ